MKWASALSSDPNIAGAVTAVTSEISQTLDCERIEFLLFFVSSFHRESYDQIASRIQCILEVECLVGCTAQGVVARGLELEEGPGLGVMAASFDEVSVKARKLDFEQLPSEDDLPASWHDWADAGVDDAGFILLADPFNPNIEKMLEGLDYAFPDVAKIGGLASAAGKAGDNRFYLNDHIYDEGVLLISFAGKVQLDTIIAQGCRPIGAPAVITKGNASMITGLDHMPALDYIDALRKDLSAQDRKLTESSLLLGLSTDPFNDNPTHGQYLMRNLLGVDYNSGSLVMGGKVEVGQVVQLHLRDKQAARDDLEIMLNNYNLEQNEGEVVASMLFTCLGRGSYLYGTHNVDSESVQQSLGAHPITGFFCSGEIGPVSGTTSVHGYTAAIAIFRSSA